MTPTGLTFNVTRHYKNACHYNNLYLVVTSIGIFFRDTNITLKHYLFKKSYLGLVGVNDGKQQRKRFERK